jgi:hypothetical protein
MWLKFLRYLIGFLGFFLAFVPRIFSYEEDSILDNYDIVLGN